ncbi:MAG: CHAT domain-containing protein [bacterium]
MPGRPWYADRRGLLEVATARLLREGACEEVIDRIERHGSPVRTRLVQEARLDRLAPRPASAGSRAGGPPRPRPRGAGGSERHLRDRAPRRAAHLPGTAGAHGGRPARLGGRAAGRAGCRTGARSRASFRPADAGDGLLAMVPAPSSPCAPAWSGVLLTAAGCRVDTARGRPARHPGPTPRPAAPLRRRRRLPGRPRAPARLAAGGPTVSFIPSARWLMETRPPATGGTLVVADPGDDLPHARATGARLPADTRLLGQAATREAVLAHLEATRLLHFDGHGDLGAGDPFAAHLALADGPLTAMDLLAARPRLGTVVLAGCDTGTAGHLSRYESLGLAEAFLLAGADRAIAPDRPVPDAEAARFVRRFYAEGGADHPAEAFYATLEALEAEGDPAGRGWRFFGRR